jgi:uncharacterized 2Fe-2S/4Fe-4S cluster protein (DUF4445 family)
MPRHRIIFEPLGYSLTVPPGTTVLDAARKKGVVLDSECGGVGQCGQCVVIARPADNLSPLTEEERQLLTAEELAAGWRLGCLARVRGPLTVVIPRAAATGTVEGKTGISGVFRVNPAVNRLVVELDSFEGLDDPAAGDVIQSLSARAGAPLPFPGIAALRQLSHTGEDSKGITIAVHEDRGVTAVLPGRWERSLGVAVDLGTTTVAAYLCDLRTGTVLASTAETNPQRRYGEDVISRIAYADANGAGLDELERQAVRIVNELIGHCLQDAEARREDVDELCLVGNTTMQHLFLGLNPASLGRAPYLPVVMEPPDCTAAELGLDLAPGTNVCVFPMASGYIGGDALAAALAEGPHRGEEITLVVDIGTNGELVLGSRAGVWAASCATGPPLEGTHISCGVRAVPGAIHRVQWEPGDNALRLEILGGAGERPAGICGSGLIDALAAMRRAGMLLDTGRFNEAHPAVSLDERGVGRKVVLVPREQSGADREIAVSLWDVRQVQLAKAALLVGIRYLMNKAGVDRVDRLVLTGAFGARFDWRNAVRIRLLPAEAVSGRVEVVDNAAGVGAIMALMDRERRREVRELARNIRVVELGVEPDFDLRFAEATQFPEPVDMGYVADVVTELERSRVPAEKLEKESAEGKLAEDASR